MISAFLSILSLAREAFGWSSTFLQYIRAQVNQSRIRFVFLGVNYTDEVIAISPITRNCNLNAGTVEVTMDNSDGAFNGFITDNTWDQQRCHVQLYFSGLEEYMNLFSGVLFKVEYIGKNAVFTLRDPMAKMLNRPVGCGEVPVAYMGGFNAATLAWMILTDSDYGNLDDTASSSNVDIDYDAWDAWHTDCTDKQYTLAAYFTGQTIRDILLRICELTDSYAWVNADGKFEFSMNADGSQMTGSENYTATNIKLLEDLPFLSIDIDNIINDLTVYYDYHVWTDTWNSGAESSTDPTSISTYGRHKFVELDKTIWHDDANSCSSYRSAFIARHKDPYTFVSFETFMASWLEEVSYTVSVTNSLLGISSMTMTIVEMTILPKEGKTRMTLWWPWSHSA